MSDAQNPGASRALSLNSTALFLRLVRPQQWIKNAVVLAGLVFAEVSDQPASLIGACIALLAFVFASSAIYVFNDLRDIEADQHHPLKRTRPLAAGLVSRTAAARFGLILAVASLVLATLVNLALAMIILTYIALMVSYTLWLKQFPILDICVIAIGFVLRAVGGAVAVAVPISPWLFVCTFLLALFLGFGKRRAELIGLGDDAGHHRQALLGYNTMLLDQLVAITAVSALVTYAVYTVVSTSVPDSGSMIFTVPVVAFAIFRYMYLVYGRGLGGSPESLLIRDRWLLVSVVAWGLLALVLMETGA